MPSFFQVKFPAFGIDISDRTIKVAAVERVKGGMRLASFGESRLEEGAVAQGKIQDFKKVAEGIGRALASVKGKPIRTRYAICALPEEQSFVRMIQLPKMPRAEIAKAVLWETEANIPIPVEQVYFDWQVIQEISSPKGPHLDLLIAAVAKEVIDPYITALEQSGLIPIVLEPESAAMARSLLKFGLSYPPVLLVDFGEMRTGLAIVSGESVRMTSTIASAGANFTDLIAVQRKLSKEAAEEQKRKFGISEETPEGLANRAVIVPALEKLILEIREYVEFYKSHAVHEHTVYTLQVSIPQQKSSFNFQPLPGEKVLVAREAGSLGITRIVLCGGESNLPGMQEYFASQMGVPTELADSFANLGKQAGEAAMDSRDTLRFPTAIGLALRSAFQ